MDTKVSLKEARPISDKLEEIMDLRHVSTHVKEKNWGQKNQNSPKNRYITGA